MAANDKPPFQKFAKVMREREQKKRQRREEKQQRGGKVWEFLVFNLLCRWKKIVFPIEQRFLEKQVDSLAFFLFFFLLLISF